MHNTSPFWRIPLIGALFLLAPQSVSWAAGPFQECAAFIKSISAYYQHSPIKFDDSGPVGVNGAPGGVVEKTVSFENPYDSAANQTGKYSIKGTYQARIKYDSAGKPSEFYGEYSDIAKTQAAIDQKRRKNGWAANTQVGLSHKFTFDYSSGRCAVRETEFSAFEDSSTSNKIVKVFGLDSVLCSRVQSALSASDRATISQCAPFIKNLAKEMQAFEAAKGAGLVTQTGKESLLYLNANEVQDIAYVADTCSSIQAGR